MDDLEAAAAARADAQTNAKVRRYRHVAVLFALSAFGAWLSFDILTQVADITHYNWFYAFRAAWIVEGIFAIILAVQVVAQWWPRSPYHTSSSSIVAQSIALGIVVTFQSLLLTNVQVGGGRHAPIPWLAVFAPLYVFDAFVLIALAYNTWFFRYGRSVAAADDDDDDDDDDIVDIVPTRRLGMLWLAAVAWTAFTIFLPLSLACMPCMPDVLVVTPLCIILLDVFVWIVFASRSHKVQRIAIALFLATDAVAATTLAMLAVSFYEAALAIVTISCLVWMFIFALMSFFKCSMRAHVAQMWHSVSDRPVSDAERGAAEALRRPMPMSNLSDLMMRQSSSSSS